VGPAVNVASWRRRRAPRARARKLRHCEQLHGILLNGSLLRAPAEDKTVRRWRLSNWIVKKKVKAGKVLVKVLVAQGHDDGAAMPRGMQRQQQPVCSRRPFLLIVALLVSLYFFFFK